MVLNIKNFIATCTTSPGVYKMIGDESRILYIGKACNLKSRLSDYLTIDSHHQRLINLVQNIRFIEVIKTNNEAEALILESNLIKKYKPKYNILLKDDKSFPYIVINKKHNFPSIAKYRGYKKDGSIYFGPFTSPKKTDDTISLLQKAFLLRSCSDKDFASRKRPCLLYQLKRCSAPCVNKISKCDYSTLVEQASEFLANKNTTLQESLAEQMDSASKAEDYEKAAIYRDRIKALSFIQAKQIVEIDSGKNFDVIAAACNDYINVIQVFFIRGGKNLGNKVYYFENEDYISASDLISRFVSEFYQKNFIPEEIILSHSLKDTEVLQRSFKALFGQKLEINHPKRGKKYELMKFALDNAHDNLKHKFMLYSQHHKHLLSIQNFFGVTKKISRIEVYDNSHISGTNAIGAMIVYDKSGFNKNEYRKYNIKFHTGNKNVADDYYMMREMLYRRLKNISSLPDLIIIDGGKGHLSVALEVCRENQLQDIFLVAISKGPRRNSGEERIYTSDDKDIYLDKSDKIKHFLQILRDEAHRFAITSHRTKRDKKMTKSILDDISDIGSIRKKELLRIFGSVDAIKEASQEELQKVKGISKTIARKIYIKLHNSL